MDWSGNANVGREWITRRHAVDNAGVKPGDTLAGRFALERPAGTGGMGEVFRAKDRETGDAVAVKVLHDHRAAADARFAREAEVLAALTSPGIVRYVAHGAGPAGEPYLVME